MPRTYKKHGPVETEASFFARVEKTETCWIWRGTLNKTGYGIFRPSKRGRFLAHRWVYMRFNGEIPEGLVVHHECVNPRCVNPAHLRAVTQRENVYASDSATRRRAEKTHCAHGHEYTPENTWRDCKGRRYCRECHRLHEKARLAAKRFGIAA